MFQTITLKYYTQTIKVMVPLLKQYMGYLLRLLDHMSGLILEYDLLALDF